MYFNDIIYRFKFLYVYDFFRHILRILKFNQIIMGL